MRTKPKIQLDLDLARALASRCLSQAEIARALGVSERLLYYRKKESADFAEAIEAGRVKGKIFVLGSFFELLEAKDEHGEYKYSEKTRLDAMKFYLERQGGWTRKDNIDLSSSDGSLSPQPAVDLSRFTAEEIIEMGKAVFRGSDGKPTSCRAPSSAHA